jgi:hypothetical protein
MSAGRSWSRTLQGCTAFELRLLARLKVEEISDRLDCLPASRFHAKILVVAALSLLFDTVDSIVKGFVLASLRTI